MTIGTSEGEPTEDRARNRESRRKAAPERGLVPREWNTDQYQEPRRARSALFGPTPSAFGDLVLSRAFDESARKEILPIP